MAQTVSNRPIIIQQDNARPHIDSNDPVFLSEANTDGFDIRLRYQPPNSPDLNVFDLGLFNSIQASKQKSVARTIDELVEVTLNAFEETKPEVINRCFLTLQNCIRP